MTGRAELRCAVWALLFLCVLADFGILEWLTFQPDVVPIDSQIFAPPPPPSLTNAGVLMLSGFLLIQVGLVLSALKLREGAIQSVFGQLNGEGPSSPRRRFPHVGS
jgi:ABC-type Na+ efflux pump permease subunit